MFFQNVIQASLKKTYSGINMNGIISAMYFVTVDSVLKNIAFSQMKYLCHV